jgi:hypothetical protein
MNIQALTTVILQKVATGALPREKCRITWFGPGTGQRCAGCDEHITAPDVECECEAPDGAPIFLHRQCFQIWDGLREDGKAAVSKS